VTRYPVEILEADANIEEDLGIDSVKLGEIFAVLREKYDLPAMSDLRGQLEPARLRTIANVAGVVAQFRRRAELVATTPPAARSTADLIDEIRVVFSEITRYPPDILDADASLEEDLGIDSVKLGEIFAVLRTRYGLPALADLKQTITPERMRSLGGIAGVIAEVVARTPAVEPADTPRPTPDDVAVIAPPTKRPFEGKIALVVGSHEGLGLDVARHLAELGAIIADDEEPAAVFERIESRFGGLDVLVHCATPGSPAPIDRITSDDWDDSFRTNVVDLHRNVILAAGLMERHGGGRIVSFSTTAADRVVPDATRQGTVAAAVESLTRYLAVELAPYNIRVNCIKTGAASNAADVRAAVTALLSDGLGFMNGGTIVVDGGQSIRA
jgi:NAD(P)-dependent dehydrogenase (short-subunit alcohol dehydrogenase family)/acyl carrier protein